MFQGRPGVRATRPCHRGRIDAPAPGDRVEVAHDVPGAVPVRDSGNAEGPALVVPTRAGPCSSALFGRPSSSCW
ncbi:DUF397 domain-containing protein [Streptomyces resistomycificus]|nr:DUF397 domain-containing protein [Streptomyces resistomycificus]